jgi:adenosylmethionine-8-amino-7-oxononanoate aminotransferase
VSSPIDPQSSHVIHRDLRSEYTLATKARGSYIFDEDGSAYLDGTAGAAVSSIGYGREEVIDAIVRQMRAVNYAHTSAWTTPVQEELARRLARLTPRGLGYLYFTSGGSESIESALKFARRYWVEREGDDSPRSVIIGREHSYHGATLGALSVGGDARRAAYLPIIKAQPKAAACYYHRYSGSLDRSDYGVKSADSFADVIEDVGRENVVGIIVEPVVGAALGAVPPPDNYLPRLREICDHYGVLMIADEVMTGMGRTGEWFAVDHWGVAPDILVTSKGLGAGYFPIGAVAVSQSVRHALEGGAGKLGHGFTYSGNPAGCAAGLAVLDFMEEHDLLTSVTQRGAELGEMLDGLHTYRYVDDVRGIGLLRGIELALPDGSPLPSYAAAGELVRRLAKHEGLSVYPGRGVTDHILIAPPLTISTEEARDLATMLGRAIRAAEPMLDRIIESGGE